MKRPSPFASSVLLAAALATGCGDLDALSDTPDDSGPTRPGEPATPAPDPAAQQAQLAAAAHQLTEDMQNVVVNLSPSFARGEDVTRALFSGRLEDLLKGNLLADGCVSLDFSDGISIAFDDCGLQNTLVDGTIAIDFDIDLGSASVAIQGGTDGLILGPNTVVGSFELTASLFNRTVSWTSSLEVENSRLAMGFVQSVWSETTFDLGVVVTNGEVELNTLDGSVPLSLAMSDVSVDVATRIATLDPGVCPDSGSIALSAPNLSGEVEFNGDGTITLYVNGVAVPQAPEVCLLADVYLSMLLGA